MQDSTLPFPINDAQMQFLAPIAQSKDNKKITRRKFTQEEDEILKNLVSTYGPTDWGTISNHFVNRTARQCRDRWKHYISPEVVTGNWTEEENQLLLQKHEEHGSQWSIIAKSFPGRTDIGVKNHYISLLSKRNKETTNKTHQRAVLIQPTQINQEIGDQGHLSNNNNNENNNNDNTSLLNPPNIQQNNIQPSLQQNIHQINQLTQLQQQFQAQLNQQQQQIQQLAQIGITDEIPSDVVQQLQDHIAQFTAENLQQLQETVQKHLQNGDTLPQLQILQHLAQQSSTLLGITEAMNQIASTQNANPANIHENNPDHASPTLNLENKSDEPVPEGI
ncbi:hypothetical protein TRFO_19820 [Tritrichomonas foetus]|uniref:Myb-like DNA-binding domain containing protein n=1 Tax=Tritrichomonas foetus TaxID=1144522 RepID=A0A1J4KHJ5_9EUKA|nr:hypothetical protein TRFO_19820 [Tritrichomonas foetus]|eukprot:OHT10833.1 hypothetical protein TRFO_19820 [Tritrichomonas foetus]